MSKKELELIIRGLLSDLTEGFAENELAYLGLQSKYEGQIRDKFAWRLQCLLGNQYLVRREWPSLHDALKINFQSSSLNGRKKVDVAILKLDQQGEIEDVLALIEFKAHMFLNNEQWPYEEFGSDVMKMKALADLVNIPSFKNSDPDLYFILLHGSPDKNCGNFASAVQYKDILNSKGPRFGCTLCNGTNDQNFISKMKGYWNRFFVSPFVVTSNQNKLQFTHPFTNMNTPNPVPQYLGESFGYKLYCAPMIWGPVKANDIKITP